MSFASKVLGRDWYGRAGAMDRTKGISQLMLLLTAYGFISKNLKDIAKGNTPSVMSIKKNSWKQNASLLFESMLLGGGLGIYGDIIDAASDRYGKGFIGTLAGPTASTIGEILNVGIKDVGGYIFGDVKGKTVGKDVIKLMKHNAPLINMWYWKSSFDYLLYYNMMDAIDPGYKRKLDRKIKKETGQEHFKYLESLRF